MDRTYIRPVPTKPGYRPLSVAKESRPREACWGPEPGSIPVELSMKLDKGLDSTVYSSVLVWYKHGPKLLDAWIAVPPFADANGAVVSRTFFAPVIESVDHGVGGSGSGSVGRGPVTLGLSSLAGLGSGVEEYFRRPTVSSLEWLRGGRSSRSRAKNLDGCCLLEN